MIEGWHYYNHAAVPNWAPHDDPPCDINELVKTKEFWESDENGNTPLLARWTSDYDCGYETNWWYTVLDKPFDMAEASSKTRQKIRKALKCYDYRRINPKEYAEQMAEIALKDYETYAASIRPDISKDELVAKFASWDLISHGAFDENGRLCAYHGIKDYGSYYQMIHGKSLPEEQKNQINAGLVYTYITDLSEYIDKGKFLTNGQRNLNHQTNFNEYLCDYFNFRKAYCKLNIAYNPKIKAIVKIAYPFRKLSQKFDNIGLVHSLNVILSMEEIVRLDSKRERKHV